MPVTIDARSGRVLLPPGPAMASGQAHKREVERFQGRLDIGLLNNMPSGAFKATERQFARLLAEASDTTDVRLHLFSLAEIPRDLVSFDPMRGGYGDLARLRTSQLDALIVTGAEPVADSLADEPYWPALTRVIDWAERNTVSTLWSCLAAHAAVLHLDGIQRRRLTRKRFGVFDCMRVAADDVFNGAPMKIRVPHSRWNDIAENDLRTHGYRIVSRSMEAGIDCFTKQWGSLFVFLQGHPEYESDTLLREYRRDVQRFTRGERHEMPVPPSDYFAAETERRIATSMDLPLRTPDLPRRSDQPVTWSIRTEQVELWQKTSVVLFRNWLTQVASIKK